MSDPAEESLILEHLYLAQIVARQAFKKFGRFAEFDDFYQQACMGVMQAVRTYDPSQGASLRTWATTCCRCRCMTLIQTALHRSKRGRRTAQLSDAAIRWLCDDRRTEADLAEDAEARAATMGRVRESIEELTTRQREAVLEMLAGVTTTEGAARRGTSRQAVDQAQKAGLASLRTMLVAR